MPGKLHDDVYDDGLQVLTDDANVLHILSADPGVTTYANIPSHTLGNKSNPTVGAPEDHTTGRKVTVSAIADGSVTDTDTATHVALVDTVNSKILAAQELDATQAVTDDNTFTLDAFYVAFPAPTA